MMNEEIVRFVLIRVLSHLRPWLLRERRNPIKRVRNLLRFLTVSYRMLSLRPFLWLDLPGRRVIFFLNRLIIFRKNQTIESLDVKDLVAHRNPIKTLHPSFQKSKGRHGRSKDKNYGCIGFARLHSGSAGIPSPRSSVHPLSPD